MNRTGLHKIFYTLLTLAVCSCKPRVTTSELLAGPPHESFQYIIISDPEGSADAFNQAFEKGYLKKQADGTIAFARPSVGLVFMGDLVGRGADSIKMRRWLV